MKGMTLENIAIACGGDLYLCNKDVDFSGKEAVSVVIDSRKIEKDGIFFATKGAKVDGHDYIDGVFKAGALGVVCEKHPENKNGNYILVDDSFVA